MRSFNTKAVVLKNIVYKDADKIYTLLSEDMGRISGIAKGVRKVSSRRSGNLDTLNLIEVHLNEHISGQNYITEVKTLESFKKIKKNLKLCKQGFYIAELINRFLREDNEAGPVFKLLVETLRELEHTKVNLIWTVNRFEIKLMHLLGYQPPKRLLFKWRENIKQKKYDQADNLIKSYVGEILQEDIKSLELD